MSRDYKPASRPEAKGGHPMFAGVLIGIFIGLGIALAVALFLKSAPSPFVAKTKPADTAAKEPEPQQQKAAPAAKAEPAKPDAAKTEAGPKPRFDFYTILPGTEQPVSEQDIKQAAQQPAQQSAQAATAGKEVFLLQVGSFQSEADADNMKAKLALIGLEAGIQTANVPDKGVLHRVRVGPFANVEDMNRARTSLAQNGIAYSLVKARAGAAPNR